MAAARPPTPPADMRPPESPSPLDMLHCPQNTVTPRRCYTSGAMTHRKVIPMDKKTLRRFWAKVNKDGPVPCHCPEIGQCWVWIGSSLTREGYGGIQLSRPRRKALTHRFSFLVHNGREATQFVMHRCDNPACVRPDHLIEGSHRDNMRDMAAKGRHRPANQWGERNGSVKYSDHTVRASLALFAIGMCRKDISTMLGIPRSAVAAFVSGKRRKRSR